LYETVGNQRLLLTFYKYCNDSSLSVFRRLLVRLATLGTDMFCCFCVTVHDVTVACPKFADEVIRLMLLEGQ